MVHSVGLDVSQKTTSICVVDSDGNSLWRGVCATDPDRIEASVRIHVGAEPLCQCTSSWCSLRPDPADVSIWRDRPEWPNIEMRR